LPRWALRAIVRKIKIAANFDAPLPSKVLRDPFDRLLIAQARNEGLMLVTTDPAMRVYDVPLL
jgi:PIN domain nuclease of toxin-antitoxin system